MLGNLAFKDWVMVKKISIFLPQVWLTNSDKFCLLTSANLPLTNVFHLSRTFSGKSENCQNDKINKIGRWTQDFWDSSWGKSYVHLCWAFWIPQKFYNSELLTWYFQIFSCFFLFLLCNHLGKSWCNENIINKDYQAMFFLFQECD